VARVEAVDGHDAVGGASGVRQRFVVVHAQVVAEPDEGGCGHASGVVMANEGGEAGGGAWGGRCVRKGEGEREQALDGQGT
jgi:hypothetical protein